MIEPRFASVDALWEFAQAYLPAGVGAGGRFNGSLGRPMFFVRGDRARLYGLDGHEYLDFNVEKPVGCYRDAAAHDVPQWHRFVQGCFERGIYFHSIGHAIGHSGISASHSVEDIDWALNRMEDVFRSLEKA